MKGKSGLRTAQEIVFYCLFGTILVFHSSVTRMVSTTLDGVPPMHAGWPCSQRCLADWVAPMYALLSGCL
jgi:hypothetical protein